MARPLVLDESLFEALAQELREGASNTSAGAVLGVSLTTFKRWKSQGERDMKEGKDTPFAHLWTVYVQARGVAQRAAEKLVFQQNPLAWLTKGPGREEWADHHVIDTNIQASIDADVRQQVLVDVRLPSDFPKGSEMRERFDKALSYMADEDLLLIDESDEDEKGDGNA